MIRIAIFWVGWTAVWIPAGRIPGLDDLLNWRFYASLIVLAIALAAAETMGERKGREKID